MTEHTSENHKNPNYAKYNVEQAKFMFDCLGYVARLKTWIDEAILRGEKSDTGWLILNNLAVPELSDPHVIDLETYKENMRLAYKVLLDVKRVNEGIPKKMELWPEGGSDIVRLGDRTLKINVLGEALLENKSGYMSMPFGKFDMYIESLRPAICIQYVGGVKDQIQTYLGFVQGSPKHEGAVKYLHFTRALTLLHNAGAAVLPDAVEVRQASLALLIEPFPPSILELMRDPSIKSKAYFASETPWDNHDIIQRLENLIKSSPSSSAKESHVDVFLKKIMALFEARRDASDKYRDLNAIISSPEAELIKADLSLEKGRRSTIEQLIKELSVHCKWHGILQMISELHIEKLHWTTYQELSKVLAEVHDTVSNSKIKNKQLALNALDSLNLTVNGKALSGGDEAADLFSSCLSVPGVLDRRNLDRPARLTLIHALSERMKSIDPKYRSKSYIHTTKDHSDKFKKYHDILSCSNALRHTLPECAVLYDPDKKKNGIVLDESETRSRQEREIARKLFDGESKHCDVLTCSSQDIEGQYSDEAKRSDILSAAILGNEEVKKLRDNIPKKCLQLIQMMPKFQKYLSEGGLAKEVHGFFDRANAVAMSDECSRQRDNFKKQYDLRYITNNLKCHLDMINPSADQPSISKSYLPEEVLQEYEQFSRKSGNLAEITREKPVILEDVKELKAKYEAFRTDHPSFGNALGHTVPDIASEWTSFQLSPESIFSGKSAQPLLTKKVIMDSFNDITPQTNSPYHIVFTAENKNQIVSEKNTHSQMWNASVIGRLLDGEELNLFSKSIPIRIPLQIEDSGSLVPHSQLRSVTVDYYVRRLLKQVHIDVDADTLRKIELKQLMARPRGLTA